MKHLHHAALCSVLFFASATPLMAFDFVDDGIYYEVISKSKKTCAVTASGKARNDYSGEVKIPSSATFKGETYAVVAIEAHAFDNCTELTTLTLSPNIRKIDKAFANCTALQMVIMEGTTPPEKKKEVFATVPVYVPKVSVNAYQSTAEWFGTKIAPSSYILHYILDGKTLYYNEVLVNQPIPRPEEPAQRGHTFSGWTGEPQGFIMPPHDVTITGEMTVNSYDATYIIDGELYEKKSFNYGARMVHPIPHEYDAYDFSNWEGAPDDQLMPDHDVTLTGHYNLNVMKAVSRLSLNYDEVREYCVTKPFTGRTAPQAKAATKNDWGYDLPDHKPGDKLFHHPDGFNEEMVRYDDDWYRWIQAYESDPIEMYVPADAVELVKTLQTTLFPVSLLERGPLTFAYDNQHRFRIFKFYTNGHPVTDRETDRLVNYNGEVLMMEDYSRNYEGEMTYSYYILDHYDANESGDAYKICSNMQAFTSTTPLCDEAGRMLRNAERYDDLYPCYYAFVPAECAVYTYVDDPITGKATLGKFSLVGNK